VRRVLVITTLLIIVNVMIFVSKATASRSDAERVICQIFGPYCSQALRVSYCETGGTYSTSARNGQYLGLFQMGSYARARYGHGPDAWTQVTAAFRYFADSHFTWGPWTCKP
jgi:hypothetical protein